MKFYICWDEDKEIIKNLFRIQLFVMNEPRYK